MLFVAIYHFAISTWQLHNLVINRYEIEFALTTLYRFQKSGPCISLVPNKTPNNFILFFFRTVTVLHNFRLVILTFYASFLSNSSTALHAHPRIPPPFMLFNSHLKHTLHSPTNSAVQIEFKLDAGPMHKFWFALFSLSEAGNQTHPLNIIRDTKLSHLPAGLSARANRGCILWPFPGQYRPIYFVELIWKNNVLHF